MRYTLQARLSPAWNVVGRHLIRGTIIGTACGAGSMQLSGVRTSVCLSVPWQQRTSLDAVRSLAGCGCTALSSKCLQSTDALVIVVIAVDCFRPIRRAATVVDGVDEAASVPFPPSNAHKVYCLELTKFTTRPSTATLSNSITSIVLDLLHKFFIQLCSS